MKYILAFLALLPFAGVQADYVFQNMGTAVTNIATAATNSGNGTIFALANVRGPIRVFVTAHGNADTTNGALVIKFSTASGTASSTNAFDLAQDSNIKVTLSTLGTSTNTVSDWFRLGGARYIRVGQIENTHLGNVSNIVVRIGYEN